MVLISELKIIFESDSKRIEITFFKTTYKMFIIIQNIIRNENIASKSLKDGRDFP